MAADPEADQEFRLRILRVAQERDVREIRTARGRELDALGRRYDRFRYGAPLTETKKLS
jgi:hypothetical protein